MTTLAQRGFDALVMRFLDELEDAGDHRLPASWMPLEGLDIHPLELEVHVLCLQHQALRDAQTKAWVSHRTK